MSDFTSEEQERAQRLAAINAYLFQFAVEYNDPREITDAYALTSYLHAAAGLVRGHILGDVTAGAIEDAERVICMVQEMIDPLNRQLNIHEDTSMRLIRSAAVLVQALNALNDGGEIPGPMLNMLAHSLLCTSCNPTRIGLAVLVALGAPDET